VKTSEKPILFSTEMVKAILNGKKTQTRRIIRPHIKNRKIKNISWGKFPGSKGENWIVNYENDITNYFGYTKCPYGEIGDILWVRETWAQLKKETGIRFAYKASDKYPFGEKYIVKFKWRPSIHMPRVAARLFLKVKSIKVERLQDISEEDVLAEGIEKSIFPYQPMKPLFKKLWNSIKAKSGFEWDVNPWVWVVEFDRMETQGG